MFSTGRKLVMVLLVLGALCVLPAHATAQNQAGQSILRVIQDPGAHSIWLLRADLLHPAGPGTLVKMAGSNRITQLHRQSPQPDSSVQLPSAAPLIHAGAPVSIEQHTAHIDSFLSAIALEPAYPDTSFRLRLKGGQVLRAVAIDEHKARLVAQTTAIDPGRVRQ